MELRGNDEGHWQAKVGFSARARQTCVDGSLCRDLRTFPLMNRLVDPARRLEKEHFKQKDVYCTRTFLFKRLTTALGRILLMCAALL